MRTEYKLAENRRKGEQEEEDEVSEPEGAVVDPLVPRGDVGEGLAEEVVNSISAEPKSRRSLGTAEIGPMLAEPHWFAEGPLDASRQERCAELRDELRQTIRAKWREASESPEVKLPELIEGVDVRRAILGAQSNCKVTRELLMVQRKILGATAKDSAESLKGGADYRLSPADQVLERKVSITNRHVWVPVLPDVSVPLQDEEAKSWRRWAFEWSHLTFLEPHRPTGPTWQCLKRIGYWPDMRKDFEVWIYACAVCHQRAGSAIGCLLSLPSSKSTYINETGWK